jgi:hypothetical protein
VLWGKILPYSLPFLAAFAAYAWTQIDQDMELLKERDYLALTIMCRAGYDMRHDPLAFWKRNIEEKENMLQKLKGIYAHLDKSSRVVSEH